ncbi:MAG: hypothetical protein WCI94_13360 [Rhodospirillales bacterium]
MAWKFLTDDPDRIGSIGSRDWVSVRYYAAAATTAELFRTPPVPTLKVGGEP